MLKVFKQSISLTFLVAVMAACNDPDAFDCFKTPGERIELNISADPFHRIDVNDDVDVYLKNGPYTEITLIGGENLLPKVNINSENGILLIENENRCSWTRDYDRIEIYITAPYINEIWHFGFGNIVSLDTLRSNWLHVKGQWCSGDINLVIDTQHFFYVSNAVSMVTISGIANRAQLGHYFNDGIFDGQQLIADTVLVDHKGYTRLRVNVREELRGQILQNGTLEYLSDNPSLKVDVQGDGKLVKIGS